MCYFNKIYTYLNIYFKTRINLFIVKLLQCKEIIICFIISNCMSLKNLLIKATANSTLIIQLCVYYYVWISCIDLINIYTFSYWIHFIALSNDWLFLSTQVFSFLFIYYIVLDLIEIEYTTYITVITNFRLPFLHLIKYFITLIFVFKKFIASNIFKFTQWTTIKWSPIFKRHSYFGLWRNYRNNFFI